MVIGHFLSLVFFFVFFNYEAQVSSYGFASPFSIPSDSRLTVSTTIKSKNHRSTELDDEISETTTNHTHACLHFFLKSSFQENPQRKSMLYVFIC